MFISKANRCVQHPGPYLNEFVVASRMPGRPCPPGPGGVLAGWSWRTAEPDDPPRRGLLVCTTEVTTSDDIERFASAHR